MSEIKISGFMDPVMCYRSTSAPKKSAISHLTFRYRDCFFNVVFPITPNLTYTYIYIYIYKSTQEIFNPAQKSQIPPNFFQFLHCKTLAMHRRCIEVFPVTESEGEEILCRFERRRAEGHGLKAGGVLVRMVFVGPLFFFWF